MGKIWTNIRMQWLPRIDAETTHMKKNNMWCLPLLPAEETLKNIWTMRTRPLLPGNNTMFRKRRKKWTVCTLTSSLTPFIAMGLAQCVPITVSFPHQKERHSTPHADRILYRRNIFTKPELQAIQQELGACLGKLRPETSSSVAHGRRGMALSADSAAVAIFRQGSLRDWIVQTTGQESWELRHQDVPVEIRSYEQTGAGMAWHSDDVLFAPEPQLEVVWTLENTSDCQTLYKSSTNQCIESVQTEINSVLLVPAGGPEHCVTSLQRGRRVIVKAVYALKDSQFIQDARVTQFKASHSRKRRKR